VLVLLPPSEGKTGRTRGRPVDLDALSFPTLTDARLEVLTALAVVSSRGDGAAVLGVPEGLVAQVRRNAGWRTEPAVRVDRLYSGVLYEALDVAGLPAGARRRAARRLLIVSAAWGMLRPTDSVPPYRLAMDVTLPSVGPLATFWRPRLADVLPRLDDGLVVDCRSSTYAAAWRPTREVAERTVSVRVLSEAGGRRTVVSHQAKHTRGLVTRHLVSRPGPDPRCPHALAGAVGERFTVELTSGGSQGTHRLDVVLTGS